MNRYEKQQKQGGFTIIEVIIVLAVSAMLATSIVIWQGSVNDRARQSDAIDQLTAQLMENRTWVLSTVNVRATGHYCGPALATSPGSNRNCVVFARVVRFTPGSDQVSVHVIAGRRNVTLDELAGLAEINALRSDFSTKWRLEFEEAYRGAAEVDAVAFVRNYDSGELETYTLAPGANAANLSSYTPVGKEPAVFSFIDPAGNQAYIHVNESANSIRRSFEP